MAADQAPRTYDRTSALRSADYYWNTYNPDFLRFEDDCTNYVSQVMLAAGFPMDVRPSKLEGWWYIGKGLSTDTWSLSWAVAHSYRWFMGGSPRVEEVAAARDLKIGDTINYDFEGDGVWDHTTVVTGYDADGEPLVNAHTFNSYRRPWRYSDSPMYTPKIQYKFWHIKDDLGGTAPA